MLSGKTPLAPNSLSGCRAWSCLPGVCPEAGKSVLKVNDKSRPQSRPFLHSCGLPTGLARPRGGGRRTGRVRAWVQDLVQVWALLCAPGCHALPLRGALSGSLTEGVPGSPARTHPHSAMSLPHPPAHAHTDITCHLPESSGLALRYKAGVTARPGSTHL